METPEKWVAAISFGGWASDSQIEKYKKKLCEALTKQGIQHNNKFMFLSYNPPFEVFGRKNEIIVELNQDNVVQFSENN